MLNCIRKEIVHQLANSRWIDENGEFPIALHGYRLFRRRKRGRRISQQTRDLDGLKLDFVDSVLDASCVEQIRDELPQTVEPFQHPLRFVQFVIATLVPGTALHQLQPKTDRSNVISE